MATWSVVRFTGGASSCSPNPSPTSAVARWWPVSADFAPVDWIGTKHLGSSSSAIDDAEADDVEARDAGSDNRRVRGWAAAVVALTAAMASWVRMDLVWVSEAKEKYSDVKAN